MIMFSIIYDHHFLQNILKFKYTWVNSYSTIWLILELHAIPVISISCKIYHITFKDICVDWHSTVCLFLVHVNYFIHNIHLTHWGRVTHICINKLTIVGSNNGLSPDRCQAIIWNNAGILLIRTLGTNFSEILSAIHIFSFKKCIWKCLENGHHFVSLG